MNRGRHRKKKIIRKVTVEDLTECLKQIRSNSFYGVNDNTYHYGFRPYFFMNDEQRKT